MIEHPCVDTENNYVNLFFILNENKVLQDVVDFLINLCIDTKDIVNFTKEEEKSNDETQKKSQEETKEPSPQEESKEHIQQKEKSQVSSQSNPFNVSYPEDDELAKTIENEFIS